MPAIQGNSEAWTERLNDLARWGKTAASGTVLAGSHTGWRSGRGVSHDH
jgi:hypothetical protein